jgi:NAD(P)-dependent dehydrogenase (short-subunit alcohol dehydrogenase family)
MQAGKLSGQVVWITGAGRMRGIGAAAARRVAAEGADLVVSAIARPPGSLPAHEQEAGWRGVESLADEVRAMGRRAVAVACDVTDPAQVEACVTAAERELGPLTGLVNNAGVASAAGSAPIATMDDALWLKTIDINLNGVYRCSKAAVRAMLVHGRGGAIVNISSLAGRFGLPNYGGYCASKFGVVGLTQQLAGEVARDGIRVNCVCPGSMNSRRPTTMPSFQWAAAAKWKSWARRSPSCSAPMPATSPARPSTSMAATGWTESGGVAGNYSRDICCRQSGKFAQHLRSIGSQRTARLKRAQRYAVVTQGCITTSLPNSGCSIVCNDPRACMLGSFITSSRLRTGALGKRAAIKVSKTCAEVCGRVHCSTSASIVSIAATRFLSVA